MGEQTPSQSPGGSGQLVGYSIRFTEDLRPGDRFILVERPGRRVVTQRLAEWEPDPEDVQVFELTVTGPGQAEMRGRHRGRAQHFRPLID